LQQRENELLEQLCQHRNQALADADEGLVRPPCLLLNPAKLIEAIKSYGESTMSGMFIVDVQPRKTV